MGDKCIGSCSFGVEDLFNSKGKWGVNSIMKLKGSGELLDKFSEFGWVYLLGKFV